MAENEHVETPAVDLGDPVHQQATAIAEAILPQLEPAMQARIDAAVERMREETLASVTRGMGQVAAGLRPPRTQAGDARPFATFADYMAAVVRSSRQGAQVDAGLMEIAAATGMSEGIGADGGFLVQTDFGGELLRTIHETGLVWGRIPTSRRIPVSGNANSRKMPTIDETSRANGSRMGGVTAAWRAEGDTINGSKPKFGMITLELNDIAALSYFTVEEAQDTPGLAAFIGTLHPEEIAFRLDNALIRGDGAGKPLGVLNSPALVTVDAEAGQAADTFLYENAANMWARMPARSRSSAVWFYNQELEPQLNAMYLAIGTGGVPVFLPAGGISGTPFSTLFGRPAIPIEQASAPGDVGDIILADMSAYWAIEKGGPSQALSEHVAFTTGEVAVRTMYRVDAQPQWKSSLTPYKGSNAISPFVALAAR